MYLDDKELLGPSFVSSVYQFVKNCSISVDFTIEERTRIINALRPDVSRDGLEFTPSIAWEYFLK